MKWLYLSSVAFFASATVALKARSTEAPACSTCWVRTTTLPAPTPCPYFDSSTCVTADCVSLITTVIPTKSCDPVPTHIETCQTTCPTGCARVTTTITDGQPCVPGRPTTPCYTATETSGNVECPLETTCGYDGPTTTTVTETRPSNNYYCVTPTVTVAPTCGSNCQFTSTTTITVLS